MEAFDEKELKSLIAEGQTDGKIGERIAERIIWGDSELAPKLKEITNQEL